jgi:hypothetical protein
MVICILCSEDKFIRVEVYESSMEKKTLLLIGLIIAFLSCHIVLGEISVSKAYVKVTIINDPPEIVDMSLGPKRYYEDVDLQCSAITEDKQDDVAMLEFRWYRNGELLDVTTDTLGEEYFRKGDLIVCEITPRDEQDIGKAKNITALIRAIPLNTRITKTMLAALGVIADSSKIESVRAEKGLAGITGFAVQEIQKNPAGLRGSFLVLLLVVLVVVNLNLVMRYILRREKIVKS